MDYHGVTKNRTQLSDFTFTLASAQSGVWSPNTSPEPQPWNSLPVWPSQAGGHFLPSPPARGRPYLRRPGRLYTFLCCGLIATASRESQRRPRRKETAEEDAANRLTAPSRPVRRPHPSGGRARPWLRLGGGREGSPEAWEALTRPPAFPADSAFLSREGPGAAGGGGSEAPGEP